MKKWFFIILFILPFGGKSQSVSKIEATKTVFNNLVQAYANAKSAPKLQIVLLSTNKSVIAKYIISLGNPIIEIDEKLINICFSMGEDSLNALSIILSHELAHYYNDHEWCSDYAYALSSTNEKLSNKLKTASKDGKAEKEAFPESALSKP